MTNLGLAFSFLFRDPDWAKKTLLGALFVVLGVFGFGLIILVGYYVQVSQRVMRRDTQLLPEWDNLGIKFILDKRGPVVFFPHPAPCGKPLNCSCSCSSGTRRSYASSAIAKAS